MNTKLNFLPALCLPSLCIGSVLLSGCGGDNNNSSSNNSTTLPPLEFVHQPDHLYKEGFPLWRFARLDGNDSLSHITSIDIEYPHAMILQKGMAFGSIDAEQADLPYTASAASHILHADDIDQGENEIWSVEGDENIYLNQITANSDDYTLTKTYQYRGATFSEIAFAEGKNQLWLYDQEAHRLGSLTLTDDNEADKWNFYPLEDGIKLVDLSIVDGNLIVAYHYNNGLYTNIFEHSEDNLIYDESWQIIGYEEKMATDISLLPDGAILVAFEGDEENLYVVDREEEEPSTSPIEPSTILELDSQFAWNSAIAQPSGITPRSDGSWFVLTDQREVFIVSPDFSTIIHEGELAFADIPCIQGCTEGIAPLDDNHFFVITDSGVVGHFSVQTEGYAREAQYTLNVDDGDTFSGITLNQEQGYAYLVTNDSDENTQDKLYVFDSNNGFSQISQTVLSTDDDANIFAYNAEGIYYHNDQLFVVSEEFTQVLVLDLQGEVEYTLDFTQEQINAPSDIAILNDRIYIPGDHEDGEPTPDLHSYILPIND